MHEGVRGITYTPTIAVYRGGRKARAGGGGSGRRCWLGDGCCEADAAVAAWQRCGPAAACGPLFQARQGQQLHRGVAVSKLAGALIACLRTRHPLYRWTSSSEPMSSSCGTTSGCGASGLPGGRNAGACPHPCSTRAANLMLALSCL